MIRIILDILMLSAAAIVAALMLLFLAGAYTPVFDWLRRWGFVCQHRRDDDRDQLAGGERAMSDKLPIIEQLEAATTFSEMAEWLCACPLSIFASHGDQIEGLVSQRGFTEASVYVQRFMSAVHMTRKGEFHPAVREGTWSDDPFSCGDMNSQARQMDLAVGLIIGIDLDWHRANKVDATDAG